MTTLESQRPTPEPGPPAAGSGAARGARFGDRLRAAGPVIGWASLGSLAVLLTFPLAWIDPALPLLAAGGMVYLFVAIYFPRAFALIALCSIILSVPLAGIVGPVGRNLDELSVLIAFLSFCSRRFVTEHRLVSLPGLPWFLLYLVGGLASSYFRAVPIDVAIEGMLLAIKGLVFAFALAQLEWREKDLRIAVRAGVIAILLLLVTAVCNLIAPVPWTMTFTGRPPVGYYGGIPAVSGPFQHPAAFGRLAAVFAVAVFVYRYTVRSSAWNAVLLVLTAGMAFLTFRVKSLVGLLAALGVLTLRFARPMLLWVAVAFGPLLLILLAPPLLEFIGADVDTYIIEDSARSTITMGSLDVAANYFPFGAGFGRYGSYTASEYYSPEYVVRGFEHIYGLGRGDDGRFLNDTQWPAIVGETGWIGTIGFVIGTAVAGCSLFRAVPGEAPLVRWLRLCGVGWLVLLITESIAAPVFGSPPAYPFLFAAVGMIASMRASRTLMGESARDSSLAFRGTFVRG
ncbi:hypothetical protein ACDF64_06420 [Agromyces sp. MMS24-JH15]|uniref:hypothetical protein n=1 Tax=Agromyces sp. MMS24-JH15 TaxID=3243765 RepID=UPI003748801E